MNIAPQDYITEGSQRLLYAHPENKNLCVKIPKEHSNQRYVKREIFYTLKYQNKINCIPSYHGTVETNLGKGYVFDLITNYDGSVSETLQKSVHGATKSKYDLYIVDGLGNSDFIKICDVSKIFLKKKLIRKFTRLTHSLNLKITFN